MKLVPRTGEITRPSNNYVASVFTCQHCGITFVIESDSAIKQADYCTDCKNLPKRELKHASKNTRNN